MSETTTETPPLPRDVRVVQIRFVNELLKNHADTLKAKVKGRMLEQELERVEGDFFEGLLVSGTSRSVCAKKLHKLVESGRIKMGEFLGAVSVKIEPVKEVLSGKELEKLADEKPSSPQLRVTKKKGVEVSLVEALKAIAVSQ